MLIVLAKTVLPCGRAPVRLVGIATVTLQLIFAGPVSAEDYCAVLNGSDWRDAAGHPVHITAATVSINDLPGYSDIPYKCADNTISFNRFHEWRVTVAEDGRTALAQGPEGDSVWHIVGWATDCNFSGEWLSNGKSVTAYKRPAVVLGQKCVSESRICNSGILSGSFLFSRCVVRSRQMTPATAAMLVSSVLLIGWLVRRFLGRLS